MTWPAKRQILALLCIAAVLFAAIGLDDFGGVAEVAGPVLLFFFLVCTLICVAPDPIIPSRPLPLVLDSRPPPVA